MTSRPESELLHLTLLHTSTLTQFSHTHTHRANLDPTASTPAFASEKWAWRRHRSRASWIGRKRKSSLLLQRNEKIIKRSQRLCLCVSSQQHSSNEVAQSAPDSTHTEFCSGGMAGQGDITGLVTAIRQRGHCGWDGHKRETHMMRRRCGNSATEDPPVSSQPISSRDVHSEALHNAH